MHTCDMTQKVCVWLALKIGSNIPGALFVRGVGVEGGEEAYFTLLALVLLLFISLRLLCVGFLRHGSILLMVLFLSLVCNAHALAHPRPGDLFSPPSFI